MSGYGKIYTIMSTNRVFKRAKILATLGPATDSYEMIEQMIKSGVNGFRLNFSHGGYEERDPQIENIRKASQKIGKPVAILQDLQGPKIRLGDFDGVIEVKTGDIYTLVYDKPTEGDKELPVQYDLSKKMKVGERLYIFDGKVRSEVTKVEPGRLTIKIKNDGMVMQRKGINVPDTNFGGDVLTAKDVRDLEFGAVRDIDYVAMSFVQTAEDIVKLRELLKHHKSSAKVVAKIETQVAIRDENLEAIIKETDAVMVARGDLAVETSPEIVPIIQRKILKLAQKYGKVSIVATQMLASMQMSPEPTRAEVSDVANAVICGADCLMLSEETAVGRYPIEAISTMKRVIVYAQEHEPFAPVFYRAEDRSLQDAISSATVTLAHQLGAKAIICETKTGATAKSIASHRPSMPIVSVTADERVAQQLCLLYANKSFLRKENEQAGMEVANELVKFSLLDQGDIVVLVSGRQPGLAGGTDTIRVRVLE